MYLLGFCFVANYCRYCSYSFVVLCVMLFSFSDIITKQLDQYVRVLHRSGSLCGNFTITAQLHTLLGNMIAHSLHQRDVTDSKLTRRFLLIQCYFAQYDIK